MERNKLSWRPFSHLSNGCLDWKNSLVSVCPKTSTSLRCWLRPSSQQGQRVPLKAAGAQATGPLLGETGRAAWRRRVVPWLDRETRPEPDVSSVSQDSLSHTGSPDQGTVRSPGEPVWLVQPSPGGFSQQGIARRTRPAAWRPAFCFLGLM